MAQPVRVMQRKLGLATRKIWRENSKVFFCFFFLKNAPILASYVYFPSFLVTILIQIEKNIDGELGI